MGWFHTVPLLLTTESCGVFNIQNSLWLLFSIWHDESFPFFSSEWLSVTVHFDVIHDVSMTCPKSDETNHAKLIKLSTAWHGAFTKVTSLESLEQPLRVRWNWIQICGQHIPERPGATWLRQVERSRDPKCDSHISHVEKPRKESSERDAFELQAKNIHLNLHGFCFVSMMHSLLFLVELLDPLLWPRFVWSTSAQRRGSKMDSWRGFAPWLVLFSGTATSWDSCRCAGTFWVTRSYQQVSKTCLMYLFSCHSLAIYVYISTGTRAQGFPRLPSYLAFLVRNVLRLAWFSHVLAS